MAYAPDHRAFYDADSHIMELPDFLQKYADPELRADIPAVSYGASLVTDEEVASVRTLVAKSGCLEESLNRAREFVAEARAQLLALPAGAGRKKLEELADFIVIRDF